MTDRVNLYSGFLEDERCVTLCTWAEDQVVQTLTQAREYSTKHRCEFRRAAEIAFKSYLSWGVREEESLTKAILDDNPLLEKFLRYTVLKYARCMVHDDTDETFRVRVVLPTVGEFLREVHILVARRPEVYLDSFVTDAVQRKLCVHDCVRRSMMRYVESKKDEPTAAAAAAPTEYIDPMAGPDPSIGPDDSVSQIAFGTGRPAPNRQPSATARSSATTWRPNYAR